MKVSLCADWRFFLKAYDLCDRIFLVGGCHDIKTINIFLKDTQCKDYINKGQY